MTDRSPSDRILVAGLAATVGISIWVSQGTTEALVQEGHVAYAVCLPSLRMLLLDLTIAAALVAAIHWIVRRSMRIRSHGPVRIDPGTYLAPLFLLGSNVASLPLFWLPPARWWSPWLYATLDLHPVVAAIAVALVLRNIVRIFGTDPRRLTRWIAAMDRPRPVFRDIAVAVTAMLAVIAWSPKMRFSATVIGDEPKYLRYCESWWQGLGVEIEQVRDVSSTADEPAHFGRTLAMILPAVHADLRQLRQDALFLRNRRHWGHRFNTAVFAGAAFLRGKDGGLYQMHNPGISILVLPAYVIDRIWFDSRNKKFPDALFAVNSEFLLIFGLLTLAISRLVSVCGTARWAEIALPLALALSLPIGAFAFEFYPETLAALIVCATCRHLLSGSRLTHRRAAWLGAGLGFLGWLHPRFLGIGVVALAWVVLTHRDQKRQLVPALAGFAVLMCVLSLYTYHITGSVLPTAVYLPKGVDAQFAWAIVPRGLISIVFDRTYGLLPLNPMLLVALPGIGVMCARRAWRPLAIVLTVSLALIVPTAGHRLSLANTTPLRFVLAVMPLAAVPMAVWLKMVSRRTALAGVAALLMLLSIRNCVEHDLQTDKTATVMFESGVSGWNPALLFPSVDNASPLFRRGPDLALLAIWGAVAAGAVAFGYRLALEHRKDNVPTRTERLTARSLLVLAGLGTIAIAIGAPSRQRQFLVDEPDFASVASLSAPSGGCWINKTTSPVPISPP